MQSVYATTQLIAGSVTFILSNSATINVRGQRLPIFIRSRNGTRTPLLGMNRVGVNLEVLQPLVDASDPAYEVIRIDREGQYAHIP